MDQNLLTADDFSCFFNLMDKVVKLSNDKTVRKLAYSLKMCIITLWEQLLIL